MAVVGNLGLAETWEPLGAGLGLPCGCSCSSGPPTPACPPIPTPQTELCLGGHPAGQLLGPAVPLGGAPAQGPWLPWALSPTSPGVERRVRIQSLLPGSMSAGHPYLCLLLASPLPTLVPQAPKILPAVTVDSCPWLRSPSLLLSPSPTLKLPGACHLILSISLLCLGDLRQRVTN